MAVKDIIPMLEDPREVLRLTDLTDPTHPYIWSDDDTEIRIYPEPGLGSYTPWIAIIHRGILVRRMSAQFFVIEYDVPEERWEEAEDA